MWFLNSFFNITATVNFEEWEDAETLNCDLSDEETVADVVEYDVDDATAFGEAGCSNKPTSTVKRGRVNIMTSRLAAALDNAKVSDGMATHILVAAAEALGTRVEDLAINRSSINRFRKENRINESKEISSDFNYNVI